MAEIESGTVVTAQGADGKPREMRALSGVVAGGDFAVVWVCSPAEWEAAGMEGREPVGIPWPEDSVRAAADDLAVA